MVDDIKREFEGIKAGVEGNVMDVPPAPTAEDTEDWGGFGNYDQPQTAVQQQDQGYSSYYPQQVQNVASSAPMNNPSIDIERMHEIIERVVNERWDDMMAKIGNVGEWKQKVDMDLIGTKQEVVRLTGRLENLQNTVLGKVSDYDKGMLNVHSEMKALEKVLERIMEPLITNVKELQRVAEELKQIKK